MNSKSALVTVHFSEPPFGGFTYRKPSGLGYLEPGCRVRVPFGNGFRLGFVGSIEPDGDEDGLKDIDSAIDDTSLLPPDVLALTKWIADYYLCDFGEAIAAAFPAGLKTIGKSRYRLSEAGRAEPWIDTESGPTADLWRALNRESLSLKQIKGRFAEGLSLFDKFRRRGWIEASGTSPVMLREPVEKLYKRTGKFLKEAPNYVFRLNAIKQFQLRDCLLSLQEIRAGDLTKLIPGSKPAIDAFVKRGWVDVDKISKVSLTSSQDGLSETAEKEPVISAVQRLICNRIAGSIREGGYRPFLLHGVTGSGKSLIYLEAVAQALSAGKGAIVMVPEISLTPQLAGRMRRRFGQVVGILHSGMPNRQRQQVWQQIREGKVRVVVGPRSSIFAPVNDLGLVIVDEEHDESYKQDTPAPRYHGKAAAFFRASNAGATLLLGSATPDISTYYFASEGRIELLELKERHSGGARPDVRVVKWGGRSHGALFSPQLRDRLDQRLKRCEQTILLVNRRGFATLIVCPDCGKSAVCPNCDIALRYHRLESRLECHYCGFRQQVIDRCPDCGGVRLRYNGIGTERVEREIELTWPGARVARLDLDTSRKAGGPVEVLRGVAERRFDILLGTQMVAKGHDFPGVTLVGVLAADLEISQTDFRSIERGFRLLVQASGRTSRTQTQGEVIIQCFDPTIRAFRWIQSADYAALYKSELAFRQPHGYPPFGKLIGVTLKGERHDRVVEVSKEFRSALERNILPVNILGPAAPAIERLENQYRQRLIIKLPAHAGSASKRIKTAIRSTTAEFSMRLSVEEIAIALDVDAVEL